MISLDKIIYLITIFILFNIMQSKNTYDPQYQTPKTQTSVSSLNQKEINLKEMEKLKKFYDKRSSTSPADIAKS